MSSNDPAANGDATMEEASAAGAGDKSAALVFGISGEQGHHVARGLVDSDRYDPVYGASRDASNVEQCPSEPPLPSAVRPIAVDLNDPHSVRRALVETSAANIFLVTTTDLPPEGAASASLKESEELEYECIKSFFDVLLSVHESDGLSRHVVFSTLDDVQSINDESPVPFIKPLDDGSVVPHYSGKGRAGRYALNLLEPHPGLTLTLLTLPLLHSNFLASTIPLPDEGKTQWTISACFGDAAIDMFSASDLQHIVPGVLENRELYDGYNVRVSAERITLDEVAGCFADLFGKDVIYNPLTPEEVAALPIPGAPAYAQMCQFLSDERSKHDTDVTKTVMFPRRPQTFNDWLLTHSDNPAFEKVGLASDVPDILNVTVFGATGMQGTSVVKGLLADKRKRYTVRATTRHPDSDKAKAVKALDPERVTLVRADFDDVASCADAVKGADGAFLVTDFYGGAGMDPDVEEQHARNVIDACEESKTVRHLVFSTLEGVEEMNRELKLGLETVKEGEVNGKGDPLSQFDAKARAAAYAHTKRLSVTYVLMPVYSEEFFKLLDPTTAVDEKTGETTHVLSVPSDHEDAQVMCMSVDELGPAVANIFDSYQVYAGHEIGLVTDFVTMSEAAEMIKDVFFSEKDDKTGGVKKTKIEKKDATKDLRIEKGDTFAKDLGQMFRYYSKTDAVKKRRSVAKTMQLVPDARPLRKWLEENRDNAEFRQMLGLR